MKRADFLCAAAILALLTGCAAQGPRGPSTLIYHQMAWSPKAGLLVITLGQHDQGHVSDETWTYEPAKKRWTQVATDPALKGCHGTMAYDPGTGLMVFFIETRWRSIARLDLDEVSETWTFDPATSAWRNLGTSGSPPPGMLGCGMVHDDKAGRFVLFGGWSVATGKFFEDTWAFDLTTATWTRMTPPLAPPGRNFAQMCYDAKADRVVLTGGDTGGSGDGRTWLYDLAGDRWTAMDSTGPEQLTYGAMTFVPDLGASLMFGGVTPGKEKANADTWLFDAVAGTWKKLAPASAPSPRGWQAMAWDDVRKRVWLYGGGTTRNFATDEMWYFDPAKTTWLEVSRPRK